jgi:hypothetical protein
MSYFPESYHTGQPRWQGQWAGPLAVPYFPDRTRRAARLDRCADILLSEGQHSAAEGLSNLAADIRQGAAA